MFIPSRVLFINRADIAITQRLGKGGFGFINRFLCFFLNNRR